MSNKLAHYFIVIAIIVVFLFSPRPPTPNNGFFLTFLLFVLLYWQRERVRSLFVKLRWPKSDLGKFLILAVFWSLLVEKALGRQGQPQFPFIALLVSLSFTLPYFFIWYKILKKAKGFTFSEVFLLSGISGALAQTLFTPKVLDVFALAKFFPALLMALFNFLSILVMFGMLTSLPFVLIFEDKFGPGNISNTKKNLFALASVFFALPFFIFTLIILRGIL